MRRNVEDTELSKLHILAAAEKVFSRNGYSGANMDEIARLTGMTKGAIFWHYGSKLGLFEAVLGKALRRMQELHRQIFATTEDIMEQFQKIALAVQQDLAFEVLLQLASAEGERGIPQSALNTVNRGVASIFNDIRKKIEAARRRGELKANADADEILMTLVLFMSGFTQINKIKSMFMIKQALNGKAAIRALFKGLNSFRR